jgi:hypothetical protein
MADKLITIAEYMDSIEAEMARQILEDFNIRALIVGQNAADGRIGVFETVKLQVFEKDAAQAMEILESQEHSEPYQPNEFEGPQEFDGSEEFDETDEEEN